jgi:hypothetical protein
MMTNRAETDEEKEACLKEILEAWKKVPYLRLGQLIENTLLEKPPTRLFYVEDMILSDCLQMYAERAVKK